MTLSDAKEIKKGNFYYIALPIELELESSFSELIDNIKRSILSSRNQAEKLKLNSTSIAQTSQIAYID